MNNDVDAPDRTMFARVRSMAQVNHGTMRGWVRSGLADAQWMAGQLDAFVRLPQRPIHRLVFVCLGNINRSAFAYAVANRLNVATSSLGLATTTGVPATAEAILTAKYFDIDLAAHRATNISDHSARDGDLFLVMEMRHAQRLIALGIPGESIALLGAWSRPRRLHLHDPHTLGLNYFHTCFTLLHSAVTNLACNLAEAKHPVAAAR